MKDKKKAIFSRSIHLMVTPVEKGFSCSVVGDNKENMTDDEYDLCNTIARGMIKLSNDNPSKVFSEGIEALSRTISIKIVILLISLSFLK